MESTGSARRQRLAMATADAAGPDGQPKPAAGDRGSNLGERAIVEFRVVLGFRLWVPPSGSQIWLRSGGPNSVQPPVCRLQDVMHVIGHGPAILLEARRAVSEGSGFPG